MLARILVIQLKLNPGALHSEINSAKCHRALEFSVYTLHNKVGEVIPAILNNMASLIF